MKNKKTIALAVASFAISALAMVGSTVAWFQAMNTANVAFSGTVVQADAKLDIGFRVPAAKLVDDAATGFVAADFLDEAEGLGLVQDATDLEVFWAPNTVSPAIMDFIIEASGHVDNVLTPITTGTYEADDVLLPFYSTPLFDANRGKEPVDERYVPLDDEADEEHYVGFSVVFRRTSDEDREIPVVGSKIYFDKNTSIQGVGVSAEALRLGFDNGAASATDIIKPTVSLADLLADGNTINVGGVMDLNGDGANDYTLLQYDTDISALAQYEIAYGSFDGVSVVGDLDWIEPGEAGYPDPADTVVPTPFSNEDFAAGKTAADVWALDATPETAEYNSFEEYTVSTDEAITRTTIAVTNASGLAEVDFALWLEGWDHACTNDIAEASYGATLTFISVDA